MTTKKVTYFNGRGRAELVRLVLSAQNEKFDDERFTFEQWGPIKPTLKYGQLPILTLENGVQMNESIAIAKYLARKTNLCGKDDWEIYLVDRAIDTISDLLLRNAIAAFEKDEKRKEELSKDLKEKHIPQYLGNLTKYIEEGKGEFLTGANPTLADIFLIQVFDNFSDAKATYPKLGNIYNKILATFPGIKKHLETRPQTPF